MCLYMLPSLKPQAKRGTLEALPKSNIDVIACLCSRYMYLTFPISRIRHLQTQVVYLQMVSCILLSLLGNYITTYLYSYYYPTIILPF